jgi:hypothetical protein
MANDLETSSIEQSLVLGRAKGRVLHIPSRRDGQARGGDKHLYASRTRFIPAAIVSNFEVYAWPLQPLNRGPHAAWRRHHRGPGRPYARHMAQHRHLIERSGPVFIAAEPFAFGTRRTGQRPSIASNVLADGLPLPRGLASMTTCEFGSSPRPASA